MDALRRLAESLSEQSRLAELLEQEKVRDMELRAAVVGQSCQLVTSSAEWYKRTIGTERRHGHVYWRLDRTYCRYKSGQLSLGQTGLDDPDITVAGLIVEVIDRPMVEVYDPPGPNGALTWSRTEDWALVVRPFDTNVSPPERMVLLGNIDWAWSRLVRQPEPAVT